MRVFTDGACTGNGKKNARAGCGVYFEESKHEISLTIDQAKNFCGIQEKILPTNNTAELLAILVSLKEARNRTNELIICSDSMYSINCICVWSKNWIKNNWKTASGGNVKNKTIIMEILERKKYFASVIFLHTNSHTPEPHDKSGEAYKLWFGNYMADKLATHSIKEVICE